MSTKVSQQRKPTKKPTAAEPIAVDPEILHDATDLLDHIIHKTDKSPRHNSRGVVVWQGDWPTFIEDAFALATKLRGLLAQVETDRAVAKALAKAGGHR